MWSGMRVGARGSEGPHAPQQRQRKRLICCLPMLILGCHQALPQQRHRHSLAALCRHAQRCRACLRQVRAQLLHQPPPRSLAVSPEC